MQRWPQLILILSMLVAAWLGMQAVHETGHVLGAWMSGGSVERVVVHPLTISRTDVGDNPHPLVVVWAGPVFGVLALLALWGVAAAAKLRGAFVLRFFAGFCLIANGLYIGIGSFEGVGDCGEMLRSGSQRWQLWLFGLITAPPGLWLWHRQGEHFGLGAAQGKVDERVAYVVLAIASALLVATAILGYFAGRVI
jgi:hypothetical protein